MRDDQITRMNEMNVRRSLLLLQQFEFMETRMEAYESVLSTPFSRIKAIFNPSWLKRCVNNKQLELLNDRKKKFEQAERKAVIKPISFVRNGNG